MKHRELDMQDAMRRWAGALLAASGLAAQANDELPGVPEPMVFDLVLALGAERGEWEANSLFEYADTSDTELEWAPEVEYALADGFGLEFEMPFEGGTLEAYKFAAQYTLGARPEAGFIHGVQVIAERFRHDSFWEWTAVYVPAVEFNDTWSALTMLGARHASGGKIEDDTEAIINAAVFAKLNEHTIFGIETNFARGDETEWLLMPQLHVELTHSWELQFGAGLEHEHGDTDAAVALRIIYASE